MAEAENRKDALYMGKPDNDDRWGVDDSQRKAVAQPQPVADRAVTQSRKRNGTLTFGKEESAQLRATGGKPLQKEEPPPLPDLTGAFRLVQHDGGSKPSPQAPVAVTPPTPQPPQPKPKDRPLSLKHTAVAMRAVSETDKAVYLQQKAERASQPVEQPRPSGEYPLLQPLPVLVQEPKGFWRRFFLTRWLFRLFGL